MPQSDPESYNFTSHDRRIADTLTTFVQSVTDALAETDADTDTIETVKKTGNDVADAVEETISKKEKKIQQLEDDLQEAKDHSGKERAELAKRVNEVEEAVEKGEFDSTDPHDDGETTIQANDLTPIERLTQSDDPSEVTDSPTVERAVSLFRNLPQWGSRTPKGIVLKPADNPLSLLEADRDESLAWKQYYRAAEALEQLSQGSVTFVDSDRHGKMIVFHQQSDAFERAVKGSLSLSSAEAST